MVIEMEAKELCFLRCGFVPKCSRDEGWGRGCGRVGSAGLKWLPRATFENLPSERKAEGAGRQMVKTRKVCYSTFPANHGLHSAHIEFMVRRKADSGAL